MRILITGMAGFIGSHLAERFEAGGHTVFGVDNFETGRGQNAPAAVELDIRDRHLFYEYANQIKPDLVVHCAASYKNPDHWHRDVDTNVTGTINAVLVAKHHNAKLVYFQTALPPTSSYAISKIAGEHYIRISGVPSLVFRLANVYGPRNLSGPIPAFFKRLSVGERCTIVHTARDMVYIRDLVDAVTKALLQNRVGTFDVCSGSAVPILALYRAVALHFKDAPEPSEIQPATDDVMPSTSVHAWLPGWAPLTPIEEGVADAVAWYRQHGVEQTFTHLKLKG